MSDRELKVRLTLLTDQYNAAMLRAGQSTERLSKDIARGTKGAAKDLQKMSTEANTAGIALLGISAAAVITAASFDKSMSGVQAVSNATAGQMDRLRQAALDAGQATVFSASEAAQAEAELAKAGVSTANILGGALKGSLDLAAASGLDLASSATIAAQAMNVFDLAGADVAHIADVLAAGANKSAADVGQLGDALRQGGLVAKQTGLGLEDTVGTLAAFADNALIGSDAGTSLKTMLMRLTPQSKEAADQMAALGIDAYDASGQFVGMSQFAGNLQGALKDLSPEARSTALNIIFGSDAARAAGIVYELGSKGIREYTTAVNDQGAASRMAGAQLDNLAGDVEQLKGALETALIKAGSDANDVLRDLTQTATGAVNVVGDLPAPVLDTALAIGTMSGAFLLAAPRIVAVNEALALSPALAKATRLAFLGLGPVAAVAALAGIVTTIVDANKETQELEDSVRSLKHELHMGVSADGIEELRGKLAEVRKQVDQPGFFGSIGQGIEQWRVWTQGADDALRSLSGFQKAAAEDRAPTTLQRQTSQLQRLEQEYAKYQGVTGEVAFALGTTATRAQDIFNASGVSLTGTIQQVTADVVAYSREQSTGKVATQNAALAFDVLSDSTSTATDKVKAYGAAWDNTVGMLLDTSDAHIAAEQAIDDLVKSLRENGNEWDIDKRKGRENVGAFNKLAEAAGRVAQKTYEQTNSTKAAQDAYDGYLDRILNSKKLTDKQKAAIKALISDGYDKLPKGPVGPDINEGGVGAQKEKIDLLLERWQAVLNQPDAVLNAHFGVTGSAPKAPGKKAGKNGGGKDGDPATPWAYGGPVSGPGTARSDSIPAWLSDGEYVHQSSAVDAFGLAFMNAVNASDVAGAAARLPSGAFRPQSVARSQFWQPAAQVIRVEASNGLHIEHLNAIAAPGERAEETVPRALRRQAFLNGMGG